MRKKDHKKNNIKFYDYTQNIIFFLFDITYKIYPSIFEQLFPNKSYTRIIIEYQFNIDRYIKSII